MSALGDHGHSADGSDPSGFVVTLRNQLEVPLKGFLLKTSRGDFTGIPEGIATKVCALCVVVHAATNTHALARCPATRTHRSSPLRNPSLLRTSPQ